MEPDVLKTQVANTEPASSSLYSSEKGQELVDEANRNIASLTPAQKTAAADVSKSFGGSGTLTPEQQKAVEDAKKNFSPGLSLTDAVTVFGNDFSGVKQNPDGTYTPNEEALGRAGVKTAPKSDAQIALEQARANYDSIVNQLTNFSQATGVDTSGITAAYQKRIDEMERVNKSREAAITQTAIRGGSRYTGGKGGVWGSIITAEEIQGVNRLAELERMKQADIAAAKEAAETKQWSRYVTLANFARDKYKDQLEEVKKLNELQAEQDAKLQEREQQLDREGKLLDGIGAGFKDISDLQKLSGMTIKEINDSLAAITGETDTSKLSADLKDFNYLKSNNLLPSSISGLTPNEQYLAWQQAVKNANTADNYTVVTDPVTGNQSVFDKKSGRFVGGGSGGGGTPVKGTGAGGKVTAGDFVLNAAKALAIKDPAGGKLLVREVSNKLGKGDVDGAMDLIRTTAYNTLTQGSKDDYDAFENSIAASTQAVQLINSSDVSTGPYKELYESKKPYALINKDPKYAQLKQLISLADSQIRRGFFGTAVTAAEGGTAASFLFDPNDNIDIIKQKLLGNLGFFSFVNDATVARQTGLPRPSLDEYLSRYGVSTTGMNDPLGLGLMSEDEPTSAGSSNNPLGL